MSSAFTALLKMSQEQTEKSEMDIRERERKRKLEDEKKRKEKEAKERKEREIAEKLRIKRMQEMDREKERLRKRAEEEELRKKEAAKKEEEARLELRYGPKKAAGLRSKGGKNDSDDDAGANALTREEKRQLKINKLLRQGGSSSTSTRRSNGTGHRTTSLADGRTVRRLPGGAVDITVVSRLADPEAAAKLDANESGKSARQRLSAMPAALVKLNTVKRDTRSIDDVWTKQPKVLAGDEAKNFSDWFGKKKKEAPEPSKPSNNGVSPYGGATPARQHSTGPSRPVSATPSPSPRPSVAPQPAPRSRPTASASHSKAGSSFMKSINPRHTPSTPSARPMASSSSRKRPASPSPSPPPKRRALGSSSSRAVGGYSEEISKSIWEAMGVDKSKYMNKNVYSDDESDMEADASEVLKEEMRSTRLAAKEDEEEFRRMQEHEEMKRRRKKEKERMEKGRMRY
ncbi:hypothetical protein M422DRAFT_243178 [Sphaerobolus stellatus SS14]|nr:hypothetical protein M422DRAFT_243178 [Sphaerobolus stellatus SS14]